MGVDEGNLILMLLVMYIEIIVENCSMTISTVHTCFYVCVFSSHSFWTSMDVPAGVTQEEGNTGFSIHLLSAVLALIFLARRVQPFLSLVDREVEFCVLTILSFSTRWAFLFSFFCFSVRKIPFAGIELTSQRVRGYMVPLSYRGDHTYK